MAWWSGVCDIKFLSLATSTRHRDILQTISARWVLPRTLTDWFAIPQSRSLPRLPLHLCMPTQYHLLCKLMHPLTPPIIRWIMAYTRVFIFARVRNFKYIFLFRIIRTLFFLFSFIRLHIYINSCISIIFLIFISFSI